MTSIGCRCHEARGRAASRRSPPRRGGWRTPRRRGRSGRWLRRRRRGDLDCRPRLEHDLRRRILADHVSGPKSGHTGQHADNGGHRASQNGDVARRFPCRLSGFEVGVGQQRSSARRRQDRHQAADRRHDSGGGDDGALPTVHPPGRLVVFGVQPPRFGDELLAFLGTFVRLGQRAVDTGDLFPEVGLGG